MEESRKIQSLIEQRKNLDNNLKIKREKIIKSILDEIINAAKKKEVYILGHKYPDCDSIVSSIILKNILKSKGIEAKFAILKDEYTYNNEDSKLLCDIIEEMPVILEEYNNNYRYILVDSNDPNQSVEDKNIDYIIGCIDHHIYTGKIKNTIEIEYASTALLIYDLFKEEYNFSDKEKELIAYSVMADTEYLASARYTLEDKDIYQKLNVKLDEEKLRKKYFVKTDFNKGIESVFLEAYKKYERDGIELNKVAFRVYNDDDKYKEQLKNYMLKKEGIWFAIWVNYENRTTEVFVKINNSKMKCFKLNYILTSANLIINEIIKRKFI